MEDDHRHCRVCRKVCAPDQEYCSKACRQERERAIATRRMWLYILYAMIAVTILLTVVNYHLY